MAKKEKQGIFMAVFGKRGYSFSAFNLAVSIKHFNPDLKIAVAHGKDFKNHLSPDDLNIFDELIEIPDSVIYNKNGRIDPGMVKCSIYDFMPFENNLYLDVDAICTQDLQPLFDHFSQKDGFYFTDVIDRGGIDSKINYSIWATNENIWNYFELDDDAQLPAIQSSFCYVKKGKEAKQFFDAVKSNFIKGFPVDQAVLWGGTIPDELIYSGTIAKFNIDPSSGIKPIFFGNYLDPRSITQIEKDHYIISMFGNGIGIQTLTKTRYIEHYDRLMFKICSEKRIAHRYKIRIIMADKHANPGKK